MGSYSQTQDDVILHLYKEKEVPDRVGSTTVRSTTIEALQRRGAIDANYQLTEDVGIPRAKALSENIDAPRDTSQFNIIFNSWQVTYDTGRTKDYGFWDKARRGAAKGLEIAGLFLKALASKKAAWVLGQAPQIKIVDNPNAESSINEWIRNNHPDVLLAMEESANLGDMYIMVNPDLSVNLIAPNVVKPVVDPKDYSRQIGWKIEQVYQNPENPMKRMSIIDTFTDKERTRTVSVGQSQGKTIRYRNPLGLVPLIHIPNNLHAGEKFGHPEGEAPLNALWGYNEIFSAGIEGNIKQGRPIPTFEKMGKADNVKAFLKNFATVRTQTQDDGSTRTYYEVNFSDLVVLGETGQFEFKSPGSFSKDTEVLLGLLFYLIVQHSEIPEFIFGNAIASSKASADSQMEPFVKWIEKEQGRAEKWFKQLIDVVMAYLSLTDVSVSGNESYTMNWASLTEGDGKLTLEAVKWAYPQGLLTEEVAIQNLQRFMTIDDAQSMLDKLAQQREDERLENEIPFVPTANEEDNEPDPEPDDEIETEISKLAKKVLSEKGHTSVMVAFEIDLDTATDLASAARQVGLDAVAPEDMHITLAYLYEMDVIEDKQGAIISAVEQFAAFTKTIRGAIGGIGRFNASDSSDGMDVIYASFDSTSLTKDREYLVELIEEAGVKVAKNHGFTPHITLAYVEKDQAMPNLVLETTELRFKRVTLYWGDERRHFDLIQPEPEMVLA